MALLELDAHELLETMAMPYKSFSETLTTSARDDFHARFLQAYMECPKPDPRHRLLRDRSVYAYSLALSENQAKMFAWMNKATFASKFCVPILCKLSSSLSKFVRSMHPNEEKSLLQRFYRIWELAVEQLPGQAQQLARQEKLLESAGSFTNLVLDSFTTEQMQSWKATGEVLTQEAEFMEVDISSDSDSVIVLPPSGIRSFEGFDRNDVFLVELQHHPNKELFFSLDLLDLEFVRSLPFAQQKQLDKELPGAFRTVRTSKPISPETAAKCSIPSRAFQVALMSLPDIRSKWLDYFRAISQDGEQPAQDGDSEDWELHGRSFGARASTSAESNSDTLCSGFDEAPTVVSSLSGTASARTLPENRSKNLPMTPSCVPYSNTTLSTPSSFSSTPSSSNSSGSTSTQPSGTATARANFERTLSHLLPSYTTDLPLSKPWKNLVLEEVQFIGELRPMEQVKLFSEMQCLLQAWTSKSMIVDDEWPQLDREAFAKAVISNEVIMVMYKSWSEWGIIDVPSKRSAGPLLSRTGVSTPKSPSSLHYFGSSSSTKHADVDKSAPPTFQAAPSPSTSSLPTATIDAHLLDDSALWLKEVKPNQLLRKAQQARPADLDLNKPLREGVPSFYCSKKGPMPSATILFQEQVLLVWSVAKKGLGPEAFALFRLLMEQRHIDGCSMMDSQMAYHVSMGRMLSSMRFRSKSFDETCLMYYQDFWKLVDQQQAPTLKSTAQSNEEKKVRERVFGGGKEVEDDDRWMDYVQMQRLRWDDVREIVAKLPLLPILDDSEIEKDANGHAESAKKGSSNRAKRRAEYHELVANDAKNSIAVRQSTKDAIGDISGALAMNTEFMKSLLPMMTAIVKNLQGQNKN